MKVVHVSYSDKAGGAAIAAYRHHESMKRAGIDSHMLVVNKVSNDNDVSIIRNAELKILWGKVLNKLLMLHAKFFAVWSWGHWGHDISDEQIIIKADAVILHWVNNYTLSIKSIERILKTGKRVYWFMHDMWPITGGCHHSLGCDKFQTHCGACPMYNRRQGHGKKKDISFRQYEEKLRRLSPYSNLSLITPSKWLADKVKVSGLFKNHNVFVVPNVLDTEIFSKRDKLTSRKRLGLPIDKKLILFGADNIHSPYKGWSYLRDALKEPINNVECVLYGNIDEDIQLEIGVPIHKLGHINDADKLVDLYSACDVFVTPSLADNYPNVLIEAMSCGLPCVGFATGGIPEIIHDGINGNIVRNYDSKELRDAIIGALQNGHLTSYSEQAIRDIRKTNNYESFVGNLGCVLNEE